MRRRPPRSTRSDTLFPYTTLFLSPRRAASLGVVADAGHVIGAFLDADDAARLEEVEEVARLDRLVIGGERDVRRDGAPAFGLGRLEAREQAVGAGDLEIPFRELPFVFEEYVAVADARRPEERRVGNECVCPRS